MAKQIEVSEENSLEEVVDILLMHEKKHHSVWCKYEDSILYSKNITLESACNLVYRCTIEEYNEMKKEKKIIVHQNDKLENVVNLLLEHESKGEHVWCKYDEYALRSRNITLESACSLVYGCTVDEYYGNESLEAEKIVDKKRQQAIEKIPELIERGKKIIFPERHKVWEKCVKENVMDGMLQDKQVESAIDVIEVLESDAPFEIVKEVLETRDAPYMSTLRIVYHFSSRGAEFYKFANDAYKTLSIKQKIQILKKQREDILLIKKYSVKENTGRSK